MIDTDVVIYTPKIDYFIEVVKYALKTHRKWYGKHDNMRKIVWFHYKEKHVYAFLKKK